MTVKFRQYRFIILSLMLAALLRVGAIAVYGNFEQPQLYEYGGIARHVLAGAGYAHVFPILHPEYGIEPRVYGNATPTAFTLPGYVFVMTAVLGGIGDNIVGYAFLYLLNLITALVSLLLLYFLTENLLSISTAKWALLLAAVFPPLVAATATFGGSTWTHMVMLGALLLVVRAMEVRRAETLALKGRDITAQGFSPGTMWKPETPSPSPERANQIEGFPWPFLLAGMMTGVWTLFRGEAFGAAVLIAVWMWMRNRSWKKAALYLAACLVIVLPWSVRNTMVFDRVVPLTTNFWLNAWRGNNEETTGGGFRSEGGSNWITPELKEEIEAIPTAQDYEIKVMDLYRARTLDFISTHPGRAAILYLQKAGMFLTLDWSDARARHPLFMYPQLLLMLFAGIGGVLLWRQRRFPWPIAIVVIVTMLSVAALHVETRYQLMMGILYIVFAAAALQKLAQRFFPDNESSAHA
ncbi:MAG: hypothetical protein WC824_15980 [Bacteroidota bacterium]